MFKKKVKSAEIDGKSKKKKGKKKKPVTHSVRRRVIKPLLHWHFIFLLFATIGIMLGAFVSVTYFSYAKDITSPEKIMNRKNSGIIIYDKNGDVLFQEGQARENKITPLNQIAPVMRNATLAAEDIHFYSHPGISVSALIASLIADTKELDLYKYGGSTITQQLVKKAILGDEKTYSRKLREIVLALQIERRYSKDQILEMYLNAVYYGAGAYGVEEAAKTYFATTPDKLTLAQASFLAGLPNAPSYLSPYGGDKEKAVERQMGILEQMREHTMITDQQAQDAKNDQLTFAPKPKGIPVRAPHFSLWVRDLVFQKFGEDAAEQYGYRVYTTLDPVMQQAAEDAVSKRVSELASYKASNGALVAMDPKTGAVKAMVGSADYYNDAIGGKFNVAVDGLGRQPGSSFKPLVYVTAFEEHLLSPASILQDKPTDFGVFGGDAFKPKNYDGTFHGNVTVRRALANSFNIPAVLALQMVGVDKALATAQKLGITTLTDPSRYGLSLVLGGGEVHLLEMVQAYDAFTNNGLLQKYNAIDRIEDKFGNSVYTRAADPESVGQQVLSPGAAYMITHILSDNNARAEVFGANSPLRLSRPAAAKTGTTDDYKDSWTIGYTPNLVAGAWIGNNDGTPMKGVAGALGAAQVWKNFMEKAVKDMPVEQFKAPDDVVQTKFCQRVQTKEVRYLDNGQPYDHLENRILAYDDVYFKGEDSKFSNCNSVPVPSGQALPSIAPIPFTSNFPEPTPVQVFNGPIPYQNDPNVLYYPQQ